MQQTVEDQSAENPVQMTQGPFQRGYVQIYTGDGKGKTTAAIGLAVRAAGAGLRVYIAQFIKMGAYSEIRALDRFADTIVCHQYGAGRWIRGKSSDEDYLLARDGFARVRGVVMSGEYQVVILDEIIMAIWLKILTVEDLVVLIEAKPQHVELILTGRRADPRLIEHADLVTEMHEVKHYYRQGVYARDGIEK